MTKARGPHGRHKETESDDPHALVIERVPGGDPELMATCLIEEYARMGMDEDQIFGLFHQGIYRTHRLYEAWGAEKIRCLIHRVMARTGRMRLTVTVSRHNGG